MLIEAKGNANTPLAAVGDSVTTPPILGRYGELLAGALLPAYAEGTLRGLLFSASTPATGVAPGTAVGTTAAYSLFNPAGSGKILVPVKVSLGFISGTLGAGNVWYLASLNSVAAATTGTTNTVVGNAIGASAVAAAQGNVGLSFTTATLPATPTIMRPAFVLAAIQSTAALADEVAGEFAIKPGCTLSLHATAAAGTTPLVAFGMSWVELAL